MDEIALRKRLRAEVFSLGVACPYDLGNPACRQLCKVRKVEPRDRLEWVESLTLDAMCVFWMFTSIALLTKSVRKQTANSVTTSRFSADSLLRLARNSSPRSRLW